VKELVLSALGLVTHYKIGVATPVGPASEAALHESRLSEVPISFDMTLADDFSVAVDEVEFAEFVVLIFEIDCPIATSGGRGIGAPGRPRYLGEFRVFVSFYRDGNGALLGDHRSRLGRFSLAASQDQEREEKE
jgi:hypothetical protein